jgi:hypothetical protein
MAKVKDDRTSRPDADNPEVTAACQIAGNRGPHFAGNRDPSWA